MNTLSNITVKQLKRAIVIREKIEALAEELGKILGSEAPTLPEAKREWRMFPSARAKIAAAQKARWAKLKGNVAGKTVKSRRKMSAAGRAAISAAAKARWAKAKTEGRMRL